jgi:hypothetical protein
MEMDGSVTSRARWTIAKAARHARRVARILACHADEQPGQIQEQRRTVG